MLQKDKTSQIFGDASAHSVKPSTKTYTFAGEDIQYDLCFA